MISSITISDRTEDAVWAEIIREIQGNTARIECAHKTVKVFKHLSITFEDGHRRRASQELRCTDCGSDLEWL